MLIPIALFACAPELSGSPVEADPGALRARWSLPVLDAAAPGRATAPEAGSFELMNVSDEVLYVHSPYSWDHTKPAHEYETGPAPKVVEWESVLLAPGEALPVTIVVEMSWIMGEPEAGEYALAADFLVYPCAQEFAEDCRTPDDYTQFEVPVTVTLTE